MEKKTHGLTGSPGKAQMVKGRFFWRVNGNFSIGTDKFTLRETLEVILC
jgi:hypothetical protein